MLDDQAQRILSLLLAVSEEALHELDDPNDPGGCRDRLFGILALLFARRDRRR